jgi:hypothetical protein
MRSAVFFALVPALAGAAIAACATGTVVNDFPDTGTPQMDGSGGGDSGCPQFDLTSDPKHCGSCTKACASTEVCAMGQCKPSCDPPLFKCAGDGGACVDLAKDKNNCGQCGTVCSVPDGGPEGGTGNPDSGIPVPDGGFDAGPGWTLGTPGCESSKCSITCAQGTLCSDNLCWDTQNAHAHCGSCTTACGGSEWCAKGHCCGQGKDWCGASCVDVLSDSQNCGACGKVCPMQTPTCSGGVCGNPTVYTQTFTSGQVPTAQCTAWNGFLSQLGTSYSSVTIKGTFDQVGFTCNNPAIASAIAQALKNNSQYISVSCNGHVWSNCNRYGGELWIDPPAVCSGANCPNPGYLLRPCFGSANIWGGVNTATCSSPTQTVTLSFQ